MTLPKLNSSELYAAVNLKLQCLRFQRSFSLERFRESFEFAPNFSNRMLINSPSMTREFQRKKTNMQDIEKAHATKDVDTAAGARGVWLVKVPKYLSEKWKRTSGNTNSDVGKLTITTSKFPDQKPNVVFTLNDGLANLKAPGEQPCPREHKMKLTGLGNQNLTVFSQVPLSATKDGEAGTSESMPNEKISIEGRVIQRAECTPLIKDTKYLDLKRLHTEMTNRPKREVIQIDTVVASYKPVSNHKSNIMYEERVKSEGKRLRADKDKVMEMLYSAFEKHQYYNVKDLVTLTKQPITYLKEILKEICVYNMKAPHRNMWELKPEYRHYKEQMPSDT